MTSIPQVVGTAHFIVATTILLILLEFANSLSSYFARCTIRSVLLSLAGFRMRVSIEKVMQWVVSLESSPAMVQCSKSRGVGAV